MLLNNGRCCGLVTMTKLVNDMLLHLVIIQWCIEIHFAFCKVAGLHLYVASRHLYKLFSPPPCGSPGLVDVVWATSMLSCVRCELWRLDVRP